jgi:hypothetical protein
MRNQAEGDCLDRQRDHRSEVVSSDNAATRQAHSITADGMRSQPEDPGIAAGDVRCCWAHIRGTEAAALRLISPC